MATKSASNVIPSNGQSIRLPLLVETVFTLSKLTVVLVGIIVMIVTFLHGNPYWVAMIRGGVTVLGLGLLVWYLSWMTAKGVVDSARQMLKEAEEVETKYTGNSMETRV
jgi:hypothetical protein